jgi:hypothetical protein
MRTFFLAAALAAAQTAPRPATPEPPRVDSKSLERSPYFAFVDRDYIFTVEMVKPGVPLLNFVSMADKERTLAAKQVRLSLLNRKVPATFFLVDTGNPKEPVVVPSVRMRPRSSFGVRLQGEFGQEADLEGAVVGLAEEDLKLVPLTSLDFENLALKINRLNLGSPDFRDDWRVLKLDTLGDRAPARRVRVVPQN